MEDGSEVCSSRVESLEEIGIVGAGQSLDFDSETENGSLVLSGVSTTNNTKHAVLRLPLGSGARRTIEIRKKAGMLPNSYEIPACGAEGSNTELKLLGYFGDDAYLPFVHSSAIDTLGQRLFVTLQLGDDEISTNKLAVGVFDLENSSYYSIPMDSSGGSSEILFGIDYDAAKGRLVGVVVNEENNGLNLRSVTVGSKASKNNKSLQIPTGSVWSEVPMTGVPSEWRYLGGNSGTVSSLDEDGRQLYFEAGGNIEGMSLGVVNIDTAKLVASPHFKGDVPISSAGLTMMSYF